MKVTVLHLRLLVIVACVLVVSGLTSGRSFAAESLISTLEAEAMILPAGTNIVSDAGSSGGKVIQFTREGTARATITIPSGAIFSSFDFRVKGVKCHGAVPKLTINMQDLATGSTSTVFSQSYSAGTWQISKVVAYVPPTPGSYTLYAIYGNHNQCGNDLYLDYFNFYSL